MMIGGSRTVDELDPIWLLNQYRAAEVTGAGVILRMSRLSDDLALSTDLSRHLRDEAVHAWLWTKAIRERGGEIVEVTEHYQERLGYHFGVPRSLTDLLALTWVSESRGVAQYQTHLDLIEADPGIGRTLRAILKDENWHVKYIHEELVRRGRRDGAVQAIIDRAQEADAKAIADIDAGAALVQPKPVDGTVPG
jgi:hypothetical protein